jgi:transcriptional regulator with XRE-family HTH domain
MEAVAEEEALAQLGTRIRQARIERDETQERFAARLGVTRATLRRLEQGNPQVSLGLLALALDRLGRLEDLQRILAPSDDLFARWDAQQTKPQRQRARRRNKTP